MFTNNIRFIGWFQSAFFLIVHYNELMRMVSVCYYIKTPVQRKYDSKYDITIIF